MNDQHFYIVILVVIGTGLFNALFTAVMVIVLNSRINDLRSDMKDRFTALEKLMDERFESLERELHHHHHEDAQ